MHKIERVSRVLSGLFIMSLAFWGLEQKAMLMGFIPAVTGWTGVCPIYKKLGLTSISGKLQRTRLFSKRSG
ncbi:MAG: YgaP family membrane protein [Bacteriovoracaceae bacterium]